LRKAYSCSFFAAISLSLLAGCGGTRKDSDGAAGQTQSTGGSGQHAGSGGIAGAGGTLANAGRGGTASGGSTPVSMPAPTCDDPPAMLGSCYSGSQCAEGTNEFGASVTNSICIPGLGFSPSDKPCSDFQMLGRCFEADPGVWRFYYNSGGPPGVESLKSACEGKGGLWCTNPPTLPAEVANVCVAACDAARPDYTEEPECVQGDDCNNRCWDLLKAPTKACAECLTASVTWPPGSCGSFECSCPPAEFAADCGSLCSP
jgi:hypothetical protein